MKLDPLNKFSVPVNLKYYARSNCESTGDVAKICCFWQCVYKPTRCNGSYEWSLFSIIWLYMFRTIASPSSGAPSNKPCNAFGTFVLSGESPDSKNVPIVPNCVIQYIMKCSWWWRNSFETCRARKNGGINILFIRIMHLVGHLHIEIWCTVHTTSLEAAFIRRYYKFV